MTLSHKEASRSVTFKLPAELYSRLEYVAFADLEADAGQDARIGDVNISEFLRSMIREFVEESEREHEGGAEALQSNYRRAEARELRNRLLAAESALAHID